MLSVNYTEFLKLALYAECHDAECRYAECHYAECHFAECHYAECRYAECQYGECHYAECHYAKCRGANFMGIFALKLCQCIKPHKVFFLANKKYGNGYNSIFKGCYYFSIPIST
jgi:hypothetical protein